jgi:hypothetical protein
MWQQSTTKIQPKMKHVSYNGNKPYINVWAHYCKVWTYNDVSLCKQATIATCTILQAYYREVWTAKNVSFE